MRIKLKSTSSIHVTKPLKARVKWLQDVFAGKDKAISSCYSKSISHWLKLGKPDIQFGLMSSLPTGEPTHMVVLDSQGKKVIYDSNFALRVSEPSVYTMVYRLGNTLTPTKMIYTGRFKDL